MIEALVSFAIGFIISYSFLYYHQKKLDLAYLLNTIKEDIINIHITLNKLTPLPDKKMK